MHKIITSDFEIDLSGYDISIQEENSWFSDTFFTKYSYPFDLIVTDEINRSLGDVLSFDSKTAKYFMPCQYIFYNKMENAFLIFERIVENIASFSLKYGMDEFPNFDKNLNELPLLKKDVVNIFTEAESTVSKTYPSTNYNFPQIHTEKYDPTTAEFHGFRKIINNRVVSGFFMNTVEVEDGEDVMYNRNIIQPMPYLMYVLHKGFELSGLTLTGDIVNDSKLQKILIYAEKEPDVQKDVTPLQMSFSDIDITSSTPTYVIPMYITGIDVTQYIVIENLTISTPGKYNILGEIDIRTNNYNYEAVLIVYKDNQVIYTKRTKFAPWTTLVDIDFIHHSGSCDIRIEAWTAIGQNQTVFDFQILPIYFINSNGEKETNLLIENKVDLTKNVPNTTFGNLVTATLNMFNYSIDSVSATEVVINKIENCMKSNEIADLTAFENINVIRKPKSDISFLLNYEAEGDMDLGGFYIDKEQMKFVTKEFNKSVENTISIPIFPLQNTLVNDVYTANSLGSSNDKILFVMYDGLQNGKNYTLESTLLIGNLIHEYHINWLKNRVNSVEYNISFLASANHVINLTTKKRAYCFNNIHLIKNITKNQLPNEMFEVELETETLVEM